MHSEVDSHINKKPKNTGGEGSVTLFEEFTEIQFDCTEGHTILGTEAQRAILKRYITPHENLEKKGSIARCNSMFGSSWA